ncbi:MAG: rod shape-determining protein MreC [Candidatus Omnitrophota bacterium]
MKVKSFILPVILIVIVVIHFIIPFRLNLIDLFRNPLSFFSSIKISIATYNQLLAENKKLKSENMSLANNQIIIDNLKRENLQLKKLFDFKQSSALKLRGANVIGGDLSGFSTTIIIDKGLKAGIRKGMVVINEGGLVGRVIDSGDDCSQVLLITDSSLSISAIISRTRSQGIICGGIGGYLIMKYVEDDDVTSGDKIITSNLSTVYPKGVLIGEVVRVEKDIFNKDLVVIVKPSVELEKLETVLVVIS